MASLTYETGSRSGYRLRFYAGKEKRFSIWLGRISETKAMEVAHFADVIAKSYQDCSVLPSRVREWIALQPPKLQKKLAKVINHKKRWRECLAQFLHHKAEAYQQKNLEQLERDVDLLVDWIHHIPVESITQAAVWNAYEKLCERYDSLEMLRRITNRWNAFLRFCKSNHWVPADATIRLPLGQPVTYFVGTIEGPRRIKIGWTAVRLRTRMSKLQGESGVRIELLGYLKGNREAEMHARFKAFNEYGEWHSPAQELLQFIEQQTITSENAMSNSPSRKKSTR